MLAYTRGHIGILIVMYSINVFLTFSLSESGMVRFWFNRRKTDKTWKKNILIQGIGFILCFCILVVMIAEKFREGAWLTVAITGVLIGLCFIIKRHYFRVAIKIREIDKAFENLPSVSETEETPEFDPEEPTAVILVGGYSGLGMHIFLNIFRLFSNSFKNVVFITVGVVNSDFFRDNRQLHTITERTEKMLEHYVSFSRRMGIAARGEFHIGTEVVEAVSKLCIEVSEKYSRTVFFAGEIVFEKPQWYHRLLHNETAYAILRRIRFAGLPMVILPIRLREFEK
jgi:K+ transporter